MSPAADRLAALAAEIRAHHGSGCGSEPCETCTQLVPGDGPADARIVVVGEAPGAQEDREGRPFVGRAGRFLFEALGEAGIARDDVFVTNVVKARPPGNRDPKAPEVAHHRPWLEEQLALVAPELVVPLGRHALTALAPKGTTITRSAGTVVEGGPWRLFPLFHPAAALRRPEVRARFGDDVRALVAALGG